MPRRSGDRLLRGSARTSTATAASNLKRTAFEHGELLAALQTRDPEVIDAALEEHIAVGTPAPTA